MKDTTLILLIIETLLLLAGLVIGGYCLWRRRSQPGSNTQRQAEESLRKLQRAVEYSHSTIVITGLDGTIEFANPAFTRITGYSLEEVLGQNPRLLKSGQTPPEVYQDLWQTLLRGEVWQGELLNRKKDGSLYWEKAVISPVPDASGKTTHYVAVKDDITLRRQAEETLKLNQERLKLLSNLFQRDFDSEQALIADALEAGVRLTGSQFGYFHFVDDPWLVEALEPPLVAMGSAETAAPAGTGPAVRLFTWSDAARAACSLAESGHFSLSTAGVWADCIRSGHPVIHNDFPSLPNRHGYPSGHPHLQRHMSVPIFDHNRVVGVCGVGNKPTPYELVDALQLQLFLDGVWRVVVRQRVESALRRSNDELRQRMQEIELLQEQLREQALRDPLTGAFNRRYLVETLARELAQAERNDQPVSLVMIDIDYFKSINDTYGHPAGDMVLQGLVQLLWDDTRRGDVVCRYGGEEFVVLLPGTPQEDAYRRAEHWRLSFAGASYAYGSHRISTTLSAGVATIYPNVAGLGGSCGDELLRAADLGLYKAKSQGRNQTVMV